MLRTPTGHSQQSDRTVTTSRARGLNRAVQAGPTSFSRAQLETLRLIDQVKVFGMAFDEQANEGTKRKHV